ncbi:hypothetical protein SAMN02745121_07909 [Nannocystis exedens]|uniref:Uncharacterized protein n=1 Tax=Nannocystis exedens TaxID=54 RepID=A0A1I2HCV8_9BACT|nr:hypothetical protein NAEX_00882 [Nannocystis exedens]SFF28085.1 hypothetical protein SAMN02745121_07909 [Nannocystis exedens]
MERKASAIEWLSKSGFYCMKQQDVLGRLPPTGRGGTRAGTPSLTPWRIAAPPVARHTAEVTFRTCPLKQLTSAPAGWRPRAASAILDELCAGGTVPAD